MGHQSAEHGSTSLPSLGQLRLNAQTLRQPAGVGVRRTTNRLQAEHHRDNPGGGRLSPCLAPAQTELLAKASACHRRGASRSNCSGGRRNAVRDGLGEMRSTSSRQTLPARRRQAEIYRLKRGFWGSSEQSPLPACDSNFTETKRRCAHGSSWFIKVLPGMSPDYRRGQRQGCNRRTCELDLKANPGTRPPVTLLNGGQPEDHVLGGGIAAIPGNDHEGSSMRLQTCRRRAEVQPARPLSI